jgi:hypothetical protein
LYALLNPVTRCLLHTRRGSFFEELAKIKKQFAKEMPTRPLVSMVQMHCTANGVDERTLVIQLG